MFPSIVRRPQAAALLDTAGAEFIELSLASLLLSGLGVAKDEDATVVFWPDAHMEPGKLTAPALAAASENVAAAEVRQERESRRKHRHCACGRRWCPRIDGVRFPSPVSRPLGPRSYDDRLGVVCSFRSIWGAETAKKSHGCWRPASDPFILVWSILCWMVVTCFYPLAKHCLTLAV